MHFYGKHIFPTEVSFENLKPASIILTSKDSLASFSKAFPHLQVLHEGGHFGVTALTLPFLNPKTREKELPKYVIIDLGDRQE